MQITLKLIDIVRDQKKCKKREKKKKKKLNNNNKHFFNFTFLYRKNYILLENIFGKF